MTKLISLSSLSFSRQVLRDRLQEKVLARMDQKDSTTDDEKRLEEACAEFESLFIYQVMKQMRKTIDQTELINGGKGEEIFTGMMDEEISKQVSLRQGLGLRDVLIEQLTGKRERVLPHPMLNKTYSRNLVVGDTEKLFVFPVIGSVSSPYGWREDPFTGRRDFHNGLDIVSPSGTEVSAADGGLVVFSGWKKGYGKVVEIEHGNDLTTLYAHNAKNLVKEGEKVAKYQTIALVGSSGKSTGSHLHYEVRRNGKAINPAKITHVSKGRWYARKF